MWCTCSQIKGNVSWCSFSFWLLWYKISQSPLFMILFVSGSCCIYIYVVVLKWTLQRDTQGISVLHWASSIFRKHKDKGKEIPLGRHQWFYVLDNLHPPYATLTFLPLSFTHPNPHLHPLLLYVLSLSPFSGLFTFFISTLSIPHLFYLFALFVLHPYSLIYNLYFLFLSLSHTQTYANMQTLYSAYTLFTFKNKDCSTSSSV